MKAINIEDIKKLVLAEAAGCCGVKLEDFENSMARNPRLVEARRISVFVLREKLGFRPKEIKEALHLKGAINALQKVAQDTYGKHDDAGKGFTEAVDDIVEVVVHAFGKVEDIQATVSGKPADTELESSSPQGRGPKRKGKKLGRRSSKRSKRPETTNSVLPTVAVIYAFSQVDGLSAENLAEGFEMTVPDVEREVGRAFFALRKDFPIINRGIERIRRVLAVK